MGNFANTVFSLLLGWVQTLASLIWSAFSSKNGESLLAFIGKHWIAIAAVLCVIGAAVDFSVYVFRWKPYEVWKNYSRKRRERKERKENREAYDPETYGEEETEGRAYPAEEYSAGSVTDEPADFRRAVSGVAAFRRTDPEDDLNRWRTEEEWEEEKQTPVRITRAGYAVPEDSPYRRPEDRQEQQATREEKLEAIRNGRRRNRLRDMFREEEEEDFGYSRPKPVINQREAYYSPVYPRNWDKDREE